ncbi:hypothetical protein GCM10010272_53190 [Streptomyces lateritius]|nr:hypothetical protein GCM10010272_53190 [Streptomyces lateritius]
MANHWSAQRHIRHRGLTRADPSAPGHLSLHVTPVGPRGRLQATQAPSIPMPSPQTAPFHWGGDATNLGGSSFLLAPPT